MSQRYIVARITKDDDRFEVLVKPQLALDYKLGRLSSVSEALVADVVYTDASKGLRASEEKLKKAFGTIDSLKIAEFIIKRGTLQLTLEQRKQLIEERRRRIIAFIARNCVDPRTNLPHPPSRIEQAMGQIHYSIDPFKDPEEQAKDVIKLLRSILPLKMEEVTVAIKVPPAYAAKARGLAKGFGIVEREEWMSNGSWTSVVKMPAGLYGPLLEKLGEVTKGAAEAKLIER